METVAALDRDRVTDVVLVTSEPTVVIDIRHGCRVRLLAVLRRLRAIQQLVGAVENRRPEDGRPCGTPGRQG